jgi:hypothetical protein
MVKESNGCAQISWLQIGTHLDKSCVRCNPVVHVTTVWNGALQDNNKIEKQCP